MTAYGYGRGKYPASSHGYVKMNGVEVWNRLRCEGPDYCRGVNILEIDPFKCTKKTLRTFDTFWYYGAGLTLRDYLKKLVNGSVIVGVTADEPSRKLKTALPTLKELGVNVADVTIRASFVFIAQKSYPSKTLLHKVVTWVETRKQPAHLNATITGMHVENFVKLAQIPL